VPALSSNWLTWLVIPALEELENLKAGAGLALIPEW
jgi:hypothetical protein